MTIEPAYDTRDAWDMIAEGYDATNTATQMWLGNEALRRAGVRAGMRFLDVAAGSGALAIPAARLGARVLATDQSPVMLELLRRKGGPGGPGRRDPLHGWPRAGSSRTRASTWPDRSSA